MAKKVAKKKTAKKRIHKRAKASGRGRGRPKSDIYSKINLDHVRFLCEKGCTDVEMCNFFGVCEKTWNVWKEKHPEFYAVLQEAKSVADSEVERSLFERAKGYVHPEEKIFCTDGMIVRADTIKHYPPDPTSCIFWLKNRQPDRWRDKQEVEHSGEVSLSDALAKARERLKKKGGNA